LIAEDSRILQDPAPVIRVSDLAENGVELVVRPWVMKEDYWAVRWQLIENVKLAFDANGFTFALPQRDIHVHHSTK